MTRQSSRQRGSIPLWVAMMLMLVVGAGVTAGPFAVSLFQTRAPSALAIKNVWVSGLFGMNSALARVSPSGHTFSVSTSDLPVGGYVDVEVTLTNRDGNTHQGLLNLSLPRGVVAELLEASNGGAAARLGSDRWAAQVAPGQDTTLKLRLAVAGEVPTGVYTVAARLEQIRS